MDWPGIIVAGVVGTAVITVFMYSAPLMNMPKMDIAQMEGSMVLPQGNAAFTTGMMMHLMMGIIFAVIYGLVWAGTDLEPNWWTGLTFGALHFIVAAVGMAMIPAMHKEMKAGRMAGPMEGGMKGVAGMLMGHLVFGLVVALVYAAFA